AAGARDVRDGGIDLEECPALALVRIGGQRAGAEADDADALQPGITVQPREQLADGPGAMVVTERLAAPRPVEELLAVDGIAVDEAAHPAHLRDPMDAEEAAGSVSAG